MKTLWVSILLLMLMLKPGPLLAQTLPNQWSLRFFATSYDQRDRVRIRIDDDLPSPAPDASARADVGAGGFTIECWVRGSTEENNSGPSRAPGDHFDYDWITGNILIDRDIWSDSPGAFRKFGVSFRGGRTEFGTGGGGIEANHTLTGSRVVLEGEWRHLALVREASSGVKRIYVDGALDRESVVGASTADLSYPDEGVASQVEPCGTGPWGPFLVLGTEKHDADWHLGGCSPPENFDYPGFSGWLDEVRVWRRALSGSEIAGWRNRVLDPDDHPDLAGYWRFEEGSGTQLSDRVMDGTPGELRSGEPGNGSWSGLAPALGSGEAGSSISGWVLY